MCVLYNKKHSAGRGGVPGRVCVGLKGIRCIGCTRRPAALPVSDAVSCFSLVSVHLILLIRAAIPGSRKRQPLLADCLPACAVQPVACAW